MTKKINRPLLVVNTGGMFSGKSTELQRQGERHILAGHKVIFIKPNIDNRYANDTITTHKGNSVQAMNVSIHKNLLDMQDVINADVILIDEIQFFNNMLYIQVDILLELGKTIYVSGLDMDYKGLPFDVTMKLMAMADVVQKFHAVCSECGEDAVHSHLIVEENVNVDNVRIGGTEAYIPLCRECNKKHDRYTFD